jgi:hypothetical protein
MIPIKDSVQRDETWLGDQLGAELVPKDWSVNHERMRAGLCPFLRATYWRWSQTIGSIAPALMDAPTILAIGDTHLENFGTWREADGRSYGARTTSTMPLSCPTRSTS